MPTSSPSATSLLALAERNAALYPNRLAVAGPSERLSWAERIGCAAGIAARIDRVGLRAGARVSLNLPSAPVWVAAFLALRRLGLTGVSIGDRARPAELEALRARFDVRLVVTNCPTNLAGASVLDVRDLAATPSRARYRHHDAALIHLTSGSSGSPKGVLRTEADLTEEARNVADALSLAQATQCSAPHPSTTASPPVCSWPACTARRHVCSWIGWRHPPSWNSRPGNRRPCLPAYRTSSER